METVEDTVLKSELWQPVFEFFKDEVKTFHWFNTPNPLLGGCRPLDMIVRGREKKLAQFIKNCQRSNLP